MQQAKGTMDCLRFLGVEMASFLLFLSLSLSLVLLSVLFYSLPAVKCFNLHRHSWVQWTQMVLKMSRFALLSLFEQ